MPMYEIQWTEVRKHKAQVIISDDATALNAALNRPDNRPQIIDWVEKDNNPIISGGATQYAVTHLGRVTEDGTKPL